jgi:hypothetical protein
MITIESLDKINLIGLFYLIKIKKTHINFITNNQ